VDFSGSRYVRTTGFPNYELGFPDLDADKIRLLASLAASRVL